MKGVIAILFMAVVLFAMPTLRQAEAADAVCAEVKIEIKQELTLERQGFDGQLKINNPLDTIALQDVTIRINFADENGNAVVASSDPNATDAKFFIRVDSLENIDTVSGGTIQPGTTAEIHWLIIPAPGAAAGAPTGKVYFVGADLEYTYGGQQESVTDRKSVV